MANSNWQERKKMAENHCVELMPEFLNIVNRFMDCKEDDRATEMLAKYIEGYSREEIAQEYGITRERVRQLIWKAVNSLKHFKVEHTPEYLQLQEQNELLFAQNTSLKSQLAQAQLKNSLLDEIELLQTFLKDTQTSLGKIKSQVSIIPSAPVEETPIFVKNIETTVRLKHILNNCKIITLSQLALTDPVELLKMPHCGRKTIKEAEELLKEYDVKVGPKWKNIDKILRGQIIREEEESIVEYAQEDTTSTEASNTSTTTGSRKERAMEKWEANKEARIKEGLPLNHGKPWEDEECAVLVESYISGKDINSISEFMGRSPWSIYAKLKLLGFELPEIEKGSMPILPEIRQFYDNPKNIEARRLYSEI